MAMVSRLTLLRLRPKLESMIHIVEMGTEMSGNVVEEEGRREISRQIVFIFSVTACSIPIHTVVETSGEEDDSIISMWLMANT